jgi:hypothetical protein
MLYDKKYRRTIKMSSLKWKSITKRSFLKRFRDRLSFVLFFTSSFICFVWIIIFYLYFKFLRTSLLTFFNDIMFFHVINFELYQNEILMLHREDRTTTQIVNHLNEIYQVKVIYRTIERRLKSWNVTIKRIKTNDSSKLRARIEILFFQSECIDEKILFFLKQKEYFIDSWKLIRIHKELDITKRIFVRDKKTSNRILLNIIKTEFDKDVAREYEKELLHYHFRTQDHIVFRFVRCYIINIFC